MSKTNTDLKTNAVRLLGQAGIGYELRQYEVDESDLSAEMEIKKLERGKMPDGIRMALPEDAPAIAAIYAPFCLETPVSFEMVAPTADEMAQRIRKVTERLPWLVLEQEGTIAGYVYASPHRERAAYQWSVDVAAYIGPDQRRKGVGRTLYTALFNLLTQQGYFNAYAGITLPNPASVGLHQAMGFEPVGIYRNVGYKLGTWHDVAWYALALQSPQADPEPLRSIYDVLTTTE